MAVLDWSQNACVRPVDARYEPCREHRNSAGPNSIPNRPLIKAPNITFRHVGNFPDTNTPESDSHAQNKSGECFRLILGATCAPQEMCATATSDPNDVLKFRMHDWLMREETYQGGMSKQLSQCAVALKTVVPHFFHQAAHEYGEDSGLHAPTCDAGPLFECERDGHGLAKFSFCCSEVKVH